MIVWLGTRGPFACVAEKSTFRLIGRDVKEVSAEHHLVDDEPDVQRQHGEKATLFLNVRVLLGLDGREDLDFVPEGLLRWVERPRECPLPPRGTGVEVRAEGQSFILAAVEELVGQVGNRSKIDHVASDGERRRLLRGQGPVKTAEVLAFACKKREVICVPTRDRTGSIRLCIAAP